MNGRVTEELEAVLDIAVRRPQGSEKAIVASIIDTGFTDELLLPWRTISDLGLVPSGETLVTLGDGSVVFMSVYEIELEWNGIWRRVKAYQGEDDALLGVALLKGMEVRITFVPQGVVQIGPV